MTALRVLIVGGAMIDTIAIIDKNHIERMSMTNADSSYLLLEEGRKTEAIEVSTHPGGGAVNAAVAMARLGLDVALIARIGVDRRGQTLLDHLDHEGVATRWVVRTADAPTGAAVLISSHEKDAAIFTFRGANVLLRPEDFPPNAFDVDLVYVSSLSNKSADCYPLIVEGAKASGACLAVNPGVRQLSARSGAFQNKLRDVQILILNRAEAEVLVPDLVSAFGEGGARLPIEDGKHPPRLEVRGLSNGGFQMSLVGFLIAMLRSGPRTVVVTDSGGGSFVADGNAIYHCPVMGRNVAGTAGAGDAFGATFASMLAEGVGVSSALQLASANAASVVTYVDTQSGLQSRVALDLLCRSGTGPPPVQRWSLDPPMWRESISI